MCMLNLSHVLCRSFLHFYWWVWFSFLLDLLHFVRRIVYISFLLTLMLWNDFILPPFNILILIAIFIWPMDMQVVEIVDRYDIDCIPEEHRSNKVAYVKDDSISKNCSRFLKVTIRFSSIYIVHGLLLQDLCK